MNIKHYQQAGFCLVLIILLVVVVVGLMGVIGWQLYGRNLTEPNQHHSSQQTDKYAGWKMYCSGLGGICFKYPADWQEAETSGSNPTSTTVTIASPSKTVEVAYSPVVMGVGGHCEPNTCFFTAKSITPLAASQATALSVVKGIYLNKSTRTILADYFLGSDDLLAPYKLKIDQRVDVGFFVNLFTSPVNSSAVEELRVKSVPDDGFTSEAEAQSWLARSEVATAGSILSSVYLNKTQQ
jgi:PsbP-like protein